NALLNAAKNNDVAEAQRLIEAGVDVNEPGIEDDTALIYAAMNNAADVASLLIESGADVDAA
ncbi:MAG: ankyrin repeat domain-containing protein, partial [Treponemataceae bacterium]|nr:ankyrin repeat domain-containing protein [Treponemataceae bacterium]